jgi:hypothetical protein
MGGDVKGETLLVKTTSLFEVMLSICLEKPDPIKHKNWLMENEAPVVPSQ